MSIQHNSTRSIPYTEHSLHISLSSSIVQQKTRHQQEPLTSVMFNRIKKKGNLVDEINTYSKHKTKQEAASLRLNLFSF